MILESLFVYFFLIGLAFWDIFFTLLEMAGLCGHLGGLYDCMVWYA
jgi:membrane associated rhomboid family serine protease